MTKKGTDIVSYITIVGWVMGLVYALQGQEKAVPLIGGLKILS